MRKNILLGKFIIGRIKSPNIFFKIETLPDFGFLAIKGYLYFASLP